MPYDVCGRCGCDLGSEELYEVREYPQGFVTEFLCHCGAFITIAARPDVFMEWVNGEGMLMGELLEHTSVEELFEFWADQESVDPDSVPVEA